MKYWYVLYVRTGSEENVKNLLGRWLDCERHLPFIPMRTLAFRRKGIVNKEKRICFPGYVFIQSSCESNEFLRELSLIVEKIKNAYMFLHYSDKSDIAMREDEKSSLSKLIGRYFCIENSVGLIEGDKIRIVSGALVGMESKIKRINRHNREAVIEIDMMGDIRQVTVVLEFIEKI